MAPLSARTLQIYLGAVPLLITQLILLVLLTLAPQIVLKNAPRPDNTATDIEIQLPPALEKK
ncbi:hypothetical protein [Microvirga sp. Mcv34]|uniref:hypothetical protein n=1 Tax=Microvirga sp. Mcv34 TaxID=2926016 RepID=UPI0021C809C8|nr:hypothetical protein [Microvirga sp. Mcv34]